MSSTSHVVTWFASSNRTGDLADCDFIFGGSHLLTEFFERVSASTSRGELLVVTPFIEIDLFQALAVFAAEQVGRFHFRIVTTPTAVKAAAEFIAKLPFLSAEICVLRSVHAKIYVFLPENGFSAALVGSHNFTTAGAFVNFEMGVLVCGRRAEPAALINGIVDHINTLRHQSSVVYDSLRWPASSFPTSTPQKGFSND